MAQIRMKDTDIGSRIDPALYGFRRGRMTMAETRIYNRCPRPWGFWKRRMRFFDWKDFARKLQINSTCIDQSLGTLVRTGSGSPFFSAFITASSYVFPCATTRSSSEENATHPSGGAAQSALMRASGLILLTCI